MPARKLLWTPDPKFAKKTNIAAYMKWLESRGQKFADYQELWKWSVDDLEGFWGSIWKYFDVADADYPVLKDRRMPGAKWFEGSDLNFAERVFRQKQDGAALISRAEKGKLKTLSWSELETKTAALAEKLREMGVAPGDRVAAYLPNSPEAVVAFLACASAGAVWSCCSPDFGPPAVVDRLSQIEPKVLFAVNGYPYGGKWFDRSSEVSSIVKALGTLEHIVEVPSGQESKGFVATTTWEETTAGKANPEYEPVPFEHPLWILYSSGTTGMPKAIVHSQGGIIVELLKTLSLHNNISARDRFFWFTTTGWMMWNYLVGGLLHGATPVLYNGDPLYPNTGALWELVEKTETTFMGGSASYFTACMKAGYEPKSKLELKKLRGIGSTGSPLSPEAFEWMYSSVKEDLWVASVSGGTDVCTGFVSGCPALPVYSGEIQCRCLGANVQAFDESGSPVVGKVGELVVTEPMPSMPLYLWGDTDGSRYRESYFEKYPGVWRHGDWIEITSRGTCIIYGRSDATIKRMGVRIGTSEIYRAVESMPEVADSLAIDVGGNDEGGGLILFLVLADGRKLDDELVSRVRAKIKAELSPRYVPDRMVEAPSVPKTLNGKKLEVPVKRILMGASPSEVLNADSLQDARSIDFYVHFAKENASGKV